MSPIVAGNVSASHPPNGDAPVQRVAAPVLVDVVTRAGGICQCTRKGCHGRTDRCERGMPAVALVAAPVDITVPAWSAWRVPTSGLIAWCPRCLDLALAAGRKARCEALRDAAEAATPPLAFAGVAR